MRQGAVLIYASAIYSWRKCKLAAADAMTLPLNLIHIFTIYRQEVIKFVEIRPRW
jgi:hypothetical protein